MSLLNAWVSPDRALVSVDTAGVGIGGISFEIGKMIPLVHANSILAGRGLSFLLHSAFTGCFLLQEEATFDLLSNWLPSVLDRHFEGYVAGCKAMYNAPEDALRVGDLVLIGYSEAAGEMAGIRMKREIGDDRFTVKAIQPWTMAPSADWSSANPPPIPDCKERMMEAARDQVRHSKQARPLEPIGGRLLVAEITRGSVTISNEGRI